MRRVNITEPGHALELTFSCLGRRRFLNDDAFKLVFLDCLGKARFRHDFHIWAYVVMPEHAHILLHPQRAEYDVSLILKGMKQPACMLCLAGWRKVSAETVPKQF